jgi:hypothetical protein
MGYANKLEMARVPVAFATGVAQQLQTQVSAIIADPNLSPEAKRSAITNFVNYSNATMSWAERFYGGSFSRFSPTEQNVQDGGAATTIAPPTSVNADAVRADPAKYEQFRQDALKNGVYYPTVNEVIGTPPTLPATMDANRRPLPVNSRGAISM